MALLGSNKSMIVERRSGERKSYNEFREADKVSTLLGFTVPSVEVYQIIGKSGRFLTEPIDKREWTPFLAEVSRVTADTQNLLGIKTGIYPQGHIVDGVYTYGLPEEGKKSQERKYKPVVLSAPGISTKQLFPNATWLIDISEKMKLALDAAEKGQPVNPILGSPEALAEIIYGFFSQDPETTGRIRVELHLGYPIVFCEVPPDLRQFNPHEKIDLPQDVQGISFVTSGLRRTRPGGSIKDTPLVICLESCPREVARQLFITQLLWRRGIRDESTTPILIARDANLLSREGDISDEDHKNMQINLEIDRRAKDKALALMVRQPRQIPKNWLETLEIQRVLSVPARELWMAKSYMYMGDWLSETELIDPRRKKMKEIEERYTKRLSSAIEFISEWPYYAPSRENQLRVAKYLSFSPLSEWREAREAFIAWPERVKSIRSLGIPRSPL